MAIRDYLGWKNNKLYRYGKGPALAMVEPDKTYPNMWRFRLVGGELSDMVNLPRAKDAASLAVDRQIRAAETPTGVG